MLLVTFQLGADRYAIEAAQVVEVLPVVEMKSVPGGAPGVAGLFDYHGEPVPAIDLTEVALGVPSRRLMSTRIILVHYPDEAGPQLLGVIAEQATQTLRRSPNEFVESGVTPGEKPFLGPVTHVDGRLVQWVKIERLLSPEVRDQLFRQPLHDA